MNTIIEVKKLHKFYGSGKGVQQHILKNIDLQIEEGEFVAIMGPSGCGKSTLLYSISGMDKMTSGSVLFEGRDFAELSEETLSAVRLDKMGFIFQQNSLLKNLNILDNIVLSSYVSGRESRSTVNARAAELMEKTGIADLAGKDITQVSGGQLQRAAICRALMNRPRIVFGDEPTGALDSKSAQAILDILTAENEAGTTILLVTHDARVAAKTERVLFMRDGVIAGELAQGKWRLQGDLATREAKLHSWLQTVNA